MDEGLYFFVVSFYLRLDGFYDPSQLCSVSFEVFKFGIGLPESKDIR